jgi:hypothetical protein
LAQDTGSARRLHGLDAALRPFKPGLRRADASCNVPRSPQPGSTVASARNRDLTEGAGLSEFESALYAQILAVSGVVLAIGWLSVSFMAPGRARSVVEWLSAVAMYTAIGSIMARWFHRFWIADNEAMIGVLGFLCLVFGSGLVVSLVMVVRTLAGRDVGADAGAVH